MSDQSPVILHPGEGRTVPVGPTTVRFLAITADTAGLSSAEEFGVPSGFEGPPKHLHTKTSHSWFVVEGDLTLTVDSAEVELGRGGFVFVPAGVAHTFGNRSDSDAKLLQFSTPSGFERYLEELQQVFPEGAEVVPAKVIEVMARHDTYPAD